MNIPKFLKKFLLRTLLFLGVANLFSVAIYFDYNHFAARFSWPALDYTETLCVVGTLFLPSVIKNIGDILFKFK